MAGAADLPRGLGFVQSGREAFARVPVQTVALMDEGGFVVRLMKALPEAFTQTNPDEQAWSDQYYLDPPLPYVALGDARIWIEDNAVLGQAARAAHVNPEFADAFRRYWDFVEREAERARDDRLLAT